MSNSNTTTTILVGLCLAVSAFSLSAQPASGAGAAGSPSSQATARQALDMTGQLPPALLAQLALNKDQQAKLDEAQIARRQLWSANRRARQNEYEAIAKELEKDQFDPRDIIKLRKKVRQDADARMDDVQNTWLGFWDSLNQSQRQSLVAYIKSQHRILGKAPAPATSPAAK